MEPKFACPFCGRERVYGLTPQAVTITGSIYLGLVREHLYFTSATFCTAECLAAYIQDEEMERWEAKHD